eukprot:scaffold25422_cov80-Isochrysis_galbana.AAC.1
MTGAAKRARERVGPVTAEATGRDRAYGRRGVGFQGAASWAEVKGRVRWWRPEPPACCPPPPPNLNLHPQLHPSPHLPQLCRLCRPRLAPQLHHRGVVHVGRAENRDRALGLAAARGSCGGDGAGTVGGACGEEGVRGRQRSRMCGADGAEKRGVERRGSHRMRAIHASPAVAFFQCSTSSGVGSAPAILAGDMPPRLASRASPAGARVGDSAGEGQAEAILEGEADGSEPVASEASCTPPSSPAVAAREGARSRLGCPPHTSLSLCTSLQHDSSCDREMSASRQEDSSPGGCSVPRRQAGRRRTTSRKYFSAWCSWVWWASWAARA